MSSKFKVQNPKLTVSGRRAVVSYLQRAAFFLLLTVCCLPFAAFGHEGEDHSADKKVTPIQGAAKAVAASASAERNVQTDAGQFTAKLTRTPSDPRTGEVVEFVLRLTEKVEGGFNDEPLPLENAGVNATVTTASGARTADTSVKAETDGNYRLSHNFQSAGDYKIVFTVTTDDKRNFTADFPVTVKNAPTNWLFWIGLTILSLLTVSIIGGVFYAFGRGERFPARIRKTAPFVIAAVLFFAFGTFALAYFQPPHKAREATTSANQAQTSAEISNALSGSVTVSKESQLLFGIRTELVAERQITSGLKVNGIVRARPDARAVVAPPVSGRIALRQGLTLGTAVGRGEQIGSVEQVLDVSGQTELESQRLEAEAQQREVEARRLEIKNNILALQAQQSQQRAAASQARTRLEQARRELRRSENLLEAGAAPRKRVEEAQTAVRVAEQEATAAEQQVKLIDDQIKTAQAGQNVFRPPSVRQPVRSFPLIAPVTGIVNEIKATSGQQVESGTELLSIVNLSTVLLEAQVFERDLPLVRESTRASFTSAALGNEVYKIGEADGDGRLVSIGQTVNPETRNIAVLYEVKNPLQRLRDGNFVEITIDTSGDRQVVAVPKRAVIRENGETFVFVFDGGETFERRAVALGSEGADFYEVKSGIKENERVVVEGVYQLRSTQSGT